MSKCNTNIIVKVLEINHYAIENKQTAELVECEALKNAAKIFEYVYITITNNIDGYSDCLIVQISDYFF